MSFCYSKLGSFTPMASRGDRKQTPNFPRSSEVPSSCVPYHFKDVHASPRNNFPPPFSPQSVLDIVFAFCLAIQYLLTIFGRAVICSVYCLASIGIIFQSTRFDLADRRSSVPVAKTKYLLSESGLSCVPASSVNRPYRLAYIVSVSMLSS